MSKNVKPVTHKRKMKNWMPQQKSHFILLVLVIMALLFIIFYFFLKNKAH
jgi:hypothetical protein